MPDVGKFGQTLLDYFAMFLLCLMLKMVELKELCFLVYWELIYLKNCGNRSRYLDSDVG